MRSSPETLRGIKHLIIDMDGVLYRGEEAIQGAAGLIRFLRERGVGFVLATNNSTRTPEQYVARLSLMDVSVAADELLTSAQATASHLTSIARRGARVFVVGQDGLRLALLDAGFALVEDGAEYVVVGMDFQVCYERLAQAALQIRAGAVFIGTNADKTFPSERGIVPGAGSLLAFLQAATDTAPAVIGKPAATMFEQALFRMAADPAKTAALGDRLETDILAGQRSGLVTLLVLSGVTDEAILSASQIQPDLVFRDAADLHAQWREALDG